MQANGTTITVPAGLKGVQVTDTEVGDVRGSEGFYHYRQYSAVDLAEERSLEDVWQLLLDGDLPTPVSEREEVAGGGRATRALPETVARELPGIVQASRAGNPLDGLRTGLSLLGSAWGLKPIWGLNEQQIRAELIRLAAATPALV